MDECKVCGSVPEETHHIKYQKDADSNGFIGHVHKNNKSNLVPLCKECHKKETYGKINIVGWVDATDGRKLKVTRGENTNNSSAVKKVLNYRGTKYNAANLSKSAKPSSGNYRGVSWSA